VTQPAPAFRSLAIDDALKHPFASIWPTVREVVDRFSRVTKAPISVYLDGTRLYGPDFEMYPKYCQLLLRSAQFRDRCVANESERVSDDAQHPRRVAECCHAGMRVERRSFVIEGLGTITVLFGAVYTQTDEAKQLRDKVIAEATEQDTSLAGELLGALQDQGKVTLPESSELALFDALTDTVRDLLAATVGFQAFAINMAHETALMLGGLGLLTRDILRRTSGEGDTDGRLTSVRSRATQIGAECNLGLYLVRNFLSHASDQRYAALVRQQLEPVDLRALLSEMTDLYQTLGRGKDVRFDMNSLGELPLVQGHAMELRRLLHNVLSNALKYSYHSTGELHRSIRFRSRVPFDPKPTSKRFSIIVENYGLGLSEDEIPQAFKPGFRGKQARQEQPIGVGIGLAESQKIMRMHNGFARIRSRPVHVDQHGKHTYLTQLELVFPYLDPASSGAPSRQ